MSGALLAQAAAPPRAGRKMLWFGCCVVGLSLVLALFGPTIAPFDPEQSTGVFSEPPPALGDWPRLLTQPGEPVHWFGTDASGLDIFSRVISAPRVDLTIGLMATLISAVLGTLLGLFAGFTRTIASELLVRLSDLLQSFPVFITAMILVSLTGRSTVNIILTLGLIFTPIFLRLTRAEVLVQSTRGYVEAARAIGNPGWRVALRHVLPNSVVPAMIQTTTVIGGCILLTATLSFVGAGVRPPAPEWGLMIAQGAPNMLVGEWWQSVFPGFAVSLTILGYAALGHALEEAYG